MAINNEKPEEKKVSEVKPVEGTAEIAKKAATPKKPAETAKKTAAAAKKTTAVAKKKTVSAKKVVEGKKVEPKVKKAEQKKNEPVLNEVRETLRSGDFDRGAVILGGGLLFMGLLLLFGRLLHIPFGVFMWPFIFIVPGVLIFLTALSTESSSGEGFSILGGLLTALGLVFFAQSVTNLWASWAYAWALVAPTSVGVSQMIFGMHKNRDTIVKSGRRLANIGLTIFTIGFVFFELILGVSGYGFGLPVFPMILIFVGLFILVRSFMRNRA